MAKFLTSNLFTSRCFSQLMKQNFARWNSTSVVSGENGNKVNVVLGAQWGDEGKGKLVDYLATDMDIICRCQGGNNAEHAAVYNNKEFHFRLLPVGYMNPKATCVIGNGVVIHVPWLLEEVEKFKDLGFADWQKRLVLSDRAHLVFDFHQDVDKLQEAERKDLSLGTIKKGIGPAYSSKAFRSGLRLCDLTGNFPLFAKRFHTLVGMYTRMYPQLTVDVNQQLDAYAQYGDQLRPVVQNTMEFLHKALDQNKRILVEGANASMLDIDFGTYPFVTSSNTTIGGVCTGLGIPPAKIGNTYGVVKTYTARYGAGPFPTELTDDIGTYFEKMEITTPPYRKIRCGWLDLVQLSYTHRINGYTALALTKLDTLDKLDEIKVGVGYKRGDTTVDIYPALDSDLTSVSVEYVTLPGWKSSTQHIRKYEELPQRAKDLIHLVKEYTGVPVKWVGVGRSREAIIEIP